MAKHLAAGMRQQFRHKYTLAFKHDPEKHVLIFYTRDPPLEWSRLYQDTFEDLYLDITGIKRMPKIRFQKDLSTRPPLAVPDYRALDKQVVISILEKMGRMPRKREFTVCAISKLFYDHQAYKVDFFDDVTNDVRLKPGLLFSKLLDEAFQLDGKMDMDNYRRLRKMVLDNYYIRHGIEVDLKYVQGKSEKRYVVFPRKITRMEIRRCLVMSGISMKAMRLRIIRPNAEAFAMTWLKRLPTRCTIFPKEMQRTRPKVQSFIRRRVYHPIRKRLRRRHRRYKYEKPLD